MTNFDLGFCYHCKSEALMMLGDVAWLFGYKNRRCPTCAQAICIICWYYTTPPCPEKSWTPDDPENPVPRNIHPIKKHDLTNCPCPECTWTCALCDAVYLAELAPPAACSVCGKCYCHACRPCAVGACALCGSLHCGATCKFGCRRAKDEVPEECE